MEKKKYVDQELVKIAKEQDVFDIMVKDGVFMTKSNGIYRHGVHDSMVITPDKGFYWFSKSIGSSNPIDYYMLVENMDFVNSTYKVLEVMNYDYSRRNIVVTREDIKNINYISGEFELPERDQDNKNVYAYLTKTRAIDKALVSNLIRKGLIYQDKQYKNAVFIGKDYEGNIVSAYKRGVFTKGKSFKGDVDGSQKDYRFRIENPDSKVVNVFESEIDLLSYITMQKILPINESYISLGGVSDKALDSYLKHNEVRTINICTDNDEKGILACKNIAYKYGKEYYITREIPITKDFNEDLLSGIEYERNRIDVVVFNDTTREMSKKEKIKYINELFKTHYQGLHVNMDFPRENNLESPIINGRTRKNYTYRDKIESVYSYQSKLNMGVEQDLIGILEKCGYQYSNDEKKHDQNAVHENTLKWHYFNKLVLIDDNVCRLNVDVREDFKHKLYVHKIRLEEYNHYNLIDNKRKRQVPLSVHKSDIQVGQLPSTIDYNITGSRIKQEKKDEICNDVAKDEEEWEI